MKTTYFIALLAGMFVLALVFGDRPYGFSGLRWMQALDLTATTLGIAIAALSVFRLFSNSFQGARLAQMLPSVVAFLGGLTLYQRYWPVPIALTAVVIGWLIAEHFRPSVKKSDDQAV
jgi:hypothetical protein